MPIQLRTPRQATLIFGLDGPSAPRPKNLFYARFKQASIGSSGWRSDLGFVVKSLDRPSIQPTVEELNQYNKKRQVHTGYKAQPIRMTLYDTADSLALQMWSEYSKHYFGDFRHDRKVSDYYYDITTDTFKDDARGGYGFAPGSSSDLNQQFFFDAVQVFQIFGRKFVQFDLINPKITGFDPDELNYEDSSAATINLTLSFEAIVYRNDGIPLDVAQEQALVEAFADKLGGSFLDLPQAESDAFAPRVRSTTYDTLPVDTNSYLPTQPASRSYGSSIGGGILSSFGVFDFGAVASTAVRKVLSGDTKHLASDLAYAATNDPVLASLLNLTTSRKPLADAASVLLSTPYVRNSSIDPATLDAARAAVNAAAGRGSVTDPDQAAAIVAGVVAAARSAKSASAGNDSLNDDAGGDRLTTAREHVSGINGGGMTLSSEAYGMLNATRSPTSQIGINRARQK